MSTLAVAGLSARLMAETAASDGFGVVALDLFGDIDTCAAAKRWFGIGAPAGLRIDGERLLSALAVLARQGEVAGWVAGSGFEGRPELLAQGAALLPLIGTAPDAVARLRDPGQFFACLAAHDIDHPPVRLTAAEDGGAWLLKDSRGCGGWHIRRVLPDVAPSLAAGQYLQREAAGLPMSATFVANGREVRLLGVNQQIVRAFGDRPYVYCGVVGPVPVAAAVRQRLLQVLPRLAAAFALHGLASLDFLLDAGRVLVLEVNPRPPASLALYPEAQPMAAHVRACLHGELPPAAARAGPLHGHETVFARQPLHLDTAAAQRLASWPDAHDLPSAGQRFAAGDPLCSVGARGGSVDELLGRLRAGCEALLHSMEKGS